MAAPKVVDVVAIDGPGGVGKSSVARRVAERLGWHYIDTGAMYRALTLAACEQGIDIDDEHALELLAARTTINLRSVDGGEIEVWLDGRNVSEEIRTNKISVATTRVADVPGVRRHLVAKQRRMGARGRVVMDGRDIATVVFPNARWKFYLDASVAERVRRRADQLMAKGIWVDSQQLARQIVERDRRDRIRPVGPLRIARDAIVIDTTDLSFDAVVELVLAHVGEAAGSGPGGPRPCGSDRRP